MFKITLQIRENEFRENFSKMINFLVWKFIKLKCTAINYIRAMNGKSTSSIHETILRTGITCNEIPL